MPPGPHDYEVPAADVGQLDDALIGYAPLAHRPDERPGLVRQFLGLGQGRIAGLPDQPVALGHPQEPQVPFIKRGHRHHGDPTGTQFEGLTEGVQARLGAVHRHQNPLIFPQALSPVLINQTVGADLGVRLLGVIGRTRRCAPYKKT